MNNILDDCTFLLHLIDSLDELIQNYNPPIIPFNSIISARSTIVRTAILQHDGIVKKLFSVIYTGEDFPENPEDKRVLAISDAVASQLK